MHAQYAWPLNVKQRRKHGQLHNYFPHYPNLVLTELIKLYCKQPVRTEVGYVHSRAESQNSEWILSNVKFSSLFNEVSRHEAVHSSTPSYAQHYTKPSGQPQVLVIYVRRKNARTCWLVAGCIPGLVWTQWGRTNSFCCWEATSLRRWWRRRFHTETIK